MTLQSFVANVKKKIPEKTLAITVVELEKYFRLELFVAETDEFFPFF